jgi:hypothetical protein
MILEDKVAYMFNKIFVSLMKDIKNINDDIKVELKNNYKIFDKKSHEYILYFVNNMNETIRKVLFSKDDILDDLEILNMHIFINITVNDLITKIIKDNVEDKNKFRHYLYMLLLISYIYTLDDMDDNKRVILFTTTMNVLNNVNKKDTTETDMESYLEDILDDDIKTVLWKMYENKDIVDINTSNDFEDKFGNLSFLQNTKIGELAKEISESIDVSKINIENPEDLLNIENMFSGSNNVLGDIIQTVGSKITDKINNGELNQEDLVQEALGMMGNMNMGNNDFMSQMMNMMNNNPNMMNPNNQNNTDRSGTRQRLQKKLQNKK